MQGKIGFRRRFFVIFAVLILACATIIPNVVGQSYVDSKKAEEKEIKNLASFRSLFRNLLIKTLSNRFQPVGILKSTLNTNCDGIELSTEIIFGRTKEIDIDNNLDTGVNGKDIKVNYFILPYIKFDFGIGLGLTFTFYIERIGAEIKDSDFSASLEIAQKTIVLGFKSPAEIGNEIPFSTRVSFNLYFYLLKRTRGFGLALTPEYSSGNDNKKIELFAEYSGEEPKREFSLLFDPAIQTEIGFESTKIKGVWNYNFYRKSSDDCQLTSNFKSIENGASKDTTITIDKLPKELKFSLGLTPLSQGGGQFLYESSDKYDIELQIISSELGICGYSYLKNTPKRIFAEWIPTFLNGEYHIDIDSNGTDFGIKDTLVNPYINLEVKSLKTIEVDAYWNLTNPGDFTVYKDTDIHVDLDFSIGEWVANLDVEPIAKNISTSWFIDISGYLTIDTNGEPFSIMDLTVKGPLIGLRIIGESFKSEDAKISWTLWPPQEWDLTITGWVIASEISSIDIYLIDSWYHLWPW